MDHFAFRVCVTCAFTASLLAGGCVGEQNVGALAGDGGSSTSASGATSGSTTSAASTSSTSPAATTSSSSAPNSLAGANAFPVHYALLDTTEPASEDGYVTVLPDGGLGAFAVILTGVDLSAVCSGDAGNPGNGQPFVDIQVKSPSYAGSTRLPDGGSPTAIQPGTYAVGFEGLSDDDLSMDTALSLVDLRSFPTTAGGGALPLGSAMSGAVVLTTVTSSRVAGTFDVALAAYSSSGFDTANPTHFAGTFDVAPCPGVRQ